MTDLPDPLAELVERWRHDAERFRAYGDERGARTCELHADELERAWASWWLEKLTVAEAAEESGYSESRLYALVEEGTIPNAGQEGAPRIPRRDLPRRPRREDESTTLPGLDVEV